MPPIEQRIIQFNTFGNPKQRECAIAWMNPDVKEIIYGGAKGGAKSYTGCSLIFSDAFTYPETRYFIARKQLNDLRKFTVPSILEVFAHWGIQSDMYNYNGQDNVYTLENGSKVFLLDAKYLPSDPTYIRFGSVQMTRGWIEEAGEFEESAKDNLFISCGRWKNDVYNLPLKLLQTCNPAKNYLYKDYREYRAGTLPKEKAFIQAFPEDNKKLPAGYVENLHRVLKGAQKQRLLFGNWEYDDSPDALIPYEKIQDLFTNSQVKKESDDMYLTADIARMGSDKAVIWIWRGWEVISEIEFAQCTLDELIATITAQKNKWNIPNSNMIADEDGVGGGVVDVLGIKGFVNNSKPKHGENYQNFKTQCYYNYARRVCAGGVYISCDLSTKQKELIVEEHEQIKSYKTDIDGKLRIIPKEQVKDNIGHSPDYTDGLMMREAFEFEYNGPGPGWFPE